MNATDIEIDVDGVFGPMTRPKRTPQRQAVEDARAAERVRQDEALGRVVERGPW